MSGVALGGFFERLRRRLGHGATAEAGAPAAMTAPAATAATAAHWSQAQELFTAAIECPPGERTAFLDDACAGEPALRREVESLLLGHDRPGILDRPAAAIVAGLVAPPPESAAGRTVAQYRILERLGGGGMGVVYRAQDGRLGRVVALKFLPPLLGADARAKERFLVEARTAAALDHPNVCTIHEIGETSDGQLFIAMPCYDGETLQQRIERGPLAVDEAVTLAIQTAHGLAKAHERGIVHRDIKPANLMVTLDGVIKIVDFGIAKLADVSLTGPGATPGTAAYMSPEQTRGELVDARTDVWALGVVLYEMLAGERPFRGARDQGVLHAIQHDEPPPLAARRPELSEALARAVHRALAKRPADRHGTIRELAAELEQLHETHRARLPHAVAPPAADPPATGLLPEGERRQATVVVSTLAGYATLVERLVPDALDRVVRALQDDAAEVAARHGGALNQCTGEGVVLLFGVPVTHEDDCQRATRAALELHRRVCERAADLGSRIDATVRLQTGIDTGRVVAQPADGGDAEYRIAGAAAGTAAWLAAHAAPDEVWITPECQRQAGPFFRTEPREPLALWSREQPLVPHRVAGESGLQTRLEAAELVGLTAYTGRDEELAALARCLDEVRRGDGQLVTVTGEAGMGKSRLLYELRRALDGDRFALLQGRCQSYGSNIAYLPFIETLRGSLGMGETDAPGSLPHDPVARIREIGPELEEFIPLYLHLLSIPSDAFVVPKQLHGEQFRLAMQEALTALLTARARRRPTVILLEDWHWVDDASHAVLEQVVEMVADCPLLVVVTSRPGYVASWGNPGRHTALLLRPLAERSSVALLTSMLQAEVLPTELGALLHERTGGNPFFLEEICQILLEDGTLRVEGGQVLLTGSLETLELPDTVEAVIRTRLDRLDRDARETLRLASVVGREFTRGILERTLADVGRLPGALGSLKSAGLIRQTRVGHDAGYRFKHVLTQEVAYASLLEHQRKELHGRVGQAIEQLHGPRIGEHLDRLAHHFSRAEEWSKAVHYGVESAKRAWTLSRFPESLQILERTQSWLARLPDDADRRSILIEIRLRQERLCETLGLRGRQQRIIDELIALLEAADDQATLAEAYVRQGDLYTLLRRFDEAEEALNRSLALRRRLADAVGERNTLRSLGLLRWHQDRNQEALAYIEQAVTIDRERNDVEALVGDLSNLGHVLKALGDCEGARRHLEEGLRLSESASTDSAGRAAGESELAEKRTYLLHILANVCRELGDDERALEYLHQAKEFAKERRLPIKLTYHYTSIAHVYLQQGRVEESLEHYREAVDLTRGAEFVPGLAQSLRFLGEVLLGLDRHDEALPHLVEAAGLFNQLEDRATEALMWSRIAAVHERRDDHAETLAAWGKARTLRQQADDAPGALEALEGIARVTRRHVSEPSLALGYYREALAIAEGLDDRAAEGRIRNTIGILEWSRGDHREALAQYERALAVFRSLGDEAGVGLMLNSIGVTLAALGRRGEARVRLEEAVALHRGAGHRRLEGHALAALGDVHDEMGETAHALECYELSLRIRRAIGDRRGEGWMLHHLARTHLALGVLGPARDLAARAAQVAADCADGELSDACGRLRRAPGL